MKRKPNTRTLRIPDRVARILADMETAGHAAELTGLSVLDLLHGLPLSGLHVRTDGPVPDGCTAVPPNGKPAPCRALSLTCGPDGLLEDPAGALPGIYRKSTPVVLDPHNPAPGLVPPLQILAVASRYGLKIGPAASAYINGPHEDAGDRAQACQWLLAFLSGNRTAKLLETYQPFFVQLIPELAPCIGLRCNPERHVYDVYGHMAKSVQACRVQDPAVRLALLLHDIAKPAVAVTDGGLTRFPQHNIAGRDMADPLLDGLGCPTELRHTALDLILYHDRALFPHPDSLALWARRIGPGNIAKLMEVKRADILAHNEKTCRRLMGQWEETRLYLYGQGIKIQPDERRTEK